LALAAVQTPRALFHPRVPQSTAAWQYPFSSLTPSFALQSATQLTSETDVSMAVDTLQGTLQAQPKPRYYLYSSKPHLAVREGI